MSGVAAVHLDGDRLREVYGDTPGYDPDSRKKIALRNARLCGLLAEQGITVVCSTISLFHEVQKWNRENIPGYREIYLRVPQAVLEERDQRKIYQKASPVAGRDYAVEEPQTPDLLLENDGTHSPESLLQKVIEAFAG